MKLSSIILIEKEEKEKIIFKETDGISPFPENTLSAIKKKITTLAKDLEQNWQSAAEITNSAMKELNVPIPQAFLKERWKQYVDLLKHAIKELYESRGLSNWTRSV